MSKNRNASRKWVSVVSMACSLMALARVGVAQDNIAWQAGTGDWFTANNWIDYSQTDPQGNFIHRVPGPTDVVRVSNGGQVQISGGAAAFVVDVNYYSSMQLFGGGLDVVSLAVGLSGDGSFSLFAGTLTCTQEWIGGEATGSFVQTGGSHLVSTDVYVGDYWGGIRGGDGEFAHTGGSLTIGRRLSVGHGTGSTGTYLLSNNASLSTGNVIVGRHGTGTLNQSGGTNISTDHITLADDGSAVGHFNLSGGSVNVTSYEAVGSEGSGSWTQTGGTNTVTGPVALAYAPGATGTYDLQGGTLTAGSMLINLGGTFTNAASVSLHGTTLFPGPSPVTSTGGLYTQSAGGSLSILIEGADPTQYGRIMVGHANLGGTLNVTLAPGYVPDVGDTFDIFTGAASGTFSQVNLPRPEWVVQYWPDRVTVGPDTDGDGILDGWELNGIPYLDANNQPQLYPLPGANRMHRDLYVEVDVMAGVPFSESSLAAVRAAFAAAPVSNPDGQDGINLHTIVDGESVPIGTGSFPESQIPVYHQNYFGTSGERTPANVGKLAAKAKAFRHCLFVNRVSSTDPGTILGEATGIPGTAFVVALGGVPWAADKIERQLGLTFMHELGHTLGFCHGGSDSTLYKPNYVSVMNYNYDEIYRQAGSTLQRLALDYSREVMDTLREACLDEHVRVGPAVGPSWSTGVIVPFAYADARVTGGRAIGHLTIGVPPVDWNVDGAINSCISEDINWFPPNNPIHFLSAASSGEPPINGFNDWPAIVYQVPPESPVQLRCPGSSRVCSLTAELVDWNSRILPPPRPCIADFDNGTGTGTPDGGVGIEDLLYYLQQYDLGTPRADVDDGSGTGTPDGGVGIEDLLYYLFRYDAGC